MTLNLLSLITLFSLTTLFSPTTLSGSIDPMPVDDKGASSNPWLVYQGKAGAGVGLHIVFVTGDEEYRSEEGMPQIARILAQHHGFRCTVLFSIDRESGEIDPETLDNIPGLAALKDADLMVIFTRFRDLPDDQMRWIAEYVESGRPVIGLRTATHAFDLRTNETYRRYSFRNSEWNGGFGRQILGETWIAHHGGHGTQSSRGIRAAGEKDHPILRGIGDNDVWDPSDVYTVRLPLPEDCRPLLMGQVLSGMSPGDPPCSPEERDGSVFDKNKPMMPVAWIRLRELDNGKTQRVFTTTLGASQGFMHAGNRRLLVNACYWALNRANEIPKQSKVDLVGKFEPTPFGFGTHKKGIRPRDLEQTDALLSVPAGDEAPEDSH